MKKLSAEQGLQTPMKMEDFTEAAMEKEDDKDLDYAFTPMAAMTGKYRKKDTRASESQYDTADFECLKNPKECKKKKDDGKNGKGRDSKDKTGGDNKKGKGKRGSKDGKDGKDGKNGQKK